MQKHNVRPEQLHLDLQYDYLKWLNNTGEEANCYETIMARFFKTAPLPNVMGDSLYWKEITCVSARDLTDFSIRF